MRQVRPLKLREELDIPATPPFHFVGTVFKPSHFPTPDTAFDGRRCWRTLRLCGQTMGVCLRAGGSRARPALHVELHADRRLSRRVVDAVSEELAFRFDLRCDVGGLERVCRRDRLLRPVLERWRGMRASAAVSLYEFLVIATLLQNTTVRRSTQMMAALFDRLGRRVAFDGRELHAFWDAADLAAVPESELREAKLGYRARILKRQADAFATGWRDEAALRRCATPELETALLELYGIGPASVAYLLFEVFKRHGAWDHVSPWEQQIFSRLMFGEECVDGRRILAEAERRWGPWKMLAAHYLFEDLFWRHREEPVSWLVPLIRM